MNWTPINLRESAHNNDVKVVVYLNEETFATASRDGSIKLWNREDLSCQELPALHEGFINSLAFCPKEACLLSGGNDNLISVWNCREGAPQGLLIAHEGNVCKLTALPPQCAPFVAASASWDVSARLWTAEWNPASSLALKDASAEGPCWSIAAVGPDTFVTAHADGVLRWWRGERCVRRIQKAHSDVIRDLAALEDGKFVASCGNDGAIKVWESATGKLVAEQSCAHPAFIYGLTAQGNLMASCGEEGWLKIWRFEGGLREETSLRVPQLSAWSAAFSPDGSELTVACSGGSIYQFSSQAPKEPSCVTEEFKKRLDAFLISLQGKQEDLERSAKPASFLLQPGARPGQNVIIKTDSGALEAHQWTGSEWQSLGQVVGKAAPSGKQRCEADGKEYDFVFKVELDDEGKSYELPYNAGENPYVVAQAFLERNELPINYLDQVAKFIFTNAGSATSVKEENAATSKEDNNVNEMTTFKEFNKDGISKKLEEFGMPQPCTIEKANEALSSWPADRIFPVIDWLRVEALKREVPVELLPFERIVEAVQGQPGSKSIGAAVTMSLRFYCNVLARKGAESLQGAEALIDIVGRATGLISLNPTWSSLLLSLLKNMKLSGKFEGKVLLALLIGVLTEAKGALRAEDSAQIAVIRSGLEAESLYSSLEELLK